MHTRRWMTQGRMACLLFVAAFSAIDVSAGESEPIGDGDKVSLEYTLKADGKTVDSNVGKDPMVYTQGGHEILPALEKSLIGLKAGDTKKVKISVEDGFGKVHPEGVRNVPKDKIPEAARKKGAMLRAEGPDGQPMMARVTEIRGDTIVVDFNHPLAGKNLE